MHDKSADWYLRFPHDCVLNDFGGRVDGFSVPLWFRSSQVCVLRFFKVKKVLSVHVLGLEMDVILCCFTADLL